MMVVLFSSGGRTQALLHVDDVLRERLALQLELRVLWPSGFKLQAKGAAPRPCSMSSILLGSGLPSCLNSRSIGHQELGFRTSTHGRRTQALLHVLDALGQRLALPLGLRHPRQHLPHPEVLRHAVIHLCHAGSVH